MCSACDAEVNGPDNQPQPSAAALTRRGLLLGGVAMALAACVRGGANRPGVGQGLWYTTVPGDTLTSLSRRSGVAVDSIAQVNDLGSPVLRSGQRLWLPGATRIAPDPLAARPAAKPEPKAPAKPAAADDDGYELVPRSAWTNEPVGPNHVLMGKVNRITVHHTDEHSGMDGKPDVEVVRMIERFHRGPQKRWAAIGYHFLVGKDGKIYEGRPVKFQGAHCGDNANNLGISVIGDMHHHLPNARQVRALKAFLDDQRVRFDVPKSRVFGHREIKPTICPGDALFAWIKAYRAA
jgi:LysM repeat protein